MSEETPLARQWLLLRSLCAKRHGVSVREMGAEMGVSQKTIRRDLDTLQSVGFKLQETVGRRGRKTWRIDRDNQQSISGQAGIDFALDEVISLYIGRHLLEPLAGTLFWDGAQRAFRKIRASLGDGASEIVERFSGLFHHTMRGASDYSRCFPRCKNRGPIEARHVLPILPSGYILFPRCKNRGECHLPT